MTEQVSLQQGQLRFRHGRRTRGRAIREENDPQLGEAAGDPRFHCSERNFEDSGNIFVGAILQVEERQGGLVIFMNLRQGGQYEGGVGLVSGLGMDHRQLLRDFLQAMVDIPDLFSARH